MRLVSTRLSPLAFIAAVFLASGCQTYDFEPVTPLALAQAGQHYTVSATGLHPDLMLLVDRSASMAYTDCPGCPTRMTQLKQAMTGFLSTYATDARIGFVAFAGTTGGTCGPASLADISTVGVNLPGTDTDSDLQAAASATSVAINKLSPTGGTPTAASLNALATYTPLTASDPNRLKLVLLLTDGLPNCSTLSVCNTAAQPNNCACTSKNPDDCNGDLHPDTCKLNCVDDQRSDLAIQALSDRQVNTVVVGFGSDLSTSSGTEISDVLNAMAQAGGYSRACPNGTDAECSGGPSGADPQDGCVVATHLCKKKFYQATTGDTLGQALTTIVQRVSHPCAWALATAPTNPKLLGVLVNGVSVAGGADTWSYDSMTQQVVFAESGTICQQLKASTEANPVNLEFEIINAL